MALSDYVAPTETIVTGKDKDGNDTTMTVRGLGLADVSKIIRVHYNDLGALFDIYEQSAGGDLSAIAAGKFTTQLIVDAPGLIAHVIALAADEEGAIEIAQRLPMMVQYEALKAIGGLTFSDIEDVKKMFAQVMGQMDKLKAPKLEQSAK